MALGGWGGVEAVRLGEHCGGRASPSWRRECAVCSRCSPPPFSHPHPAARPGMRKVPESEKGGDPPAAACDPRGEGTVSSSLVPTSGKTSSGRPRPACSRPAVGSARPALQRRPRVHRMWRRRRGEAELAASSYPTPLGLKRGLMPPNGLSTYYPWLPATENA